MPEYQNTKSNRWLTTLTIDCEKQTSPVDIIVTRKRTDRSKAYGSRRTSKFALRDCLLFGCERHSRIELLFETGALSPSEQV
ncbi:hypothetical protein ACEQPO_25455 [Bacillus sp. SL00103]